MARLRAGPQSTLEEEAMAPTAEDEPGTREPTETLCQPARRAPRGVPEQRAWYRAWRAALAVVQRRGHPETLEEALALYLQDLERRGRQLITCRDGWYSLRGFLRWTADNDRACLTDLDAELLLDYLRHVLQQGLSVYYLKQIRSGLKQLLIFLFDAGWIAEDLSARLRLVTRLPRNPTRRVLTLSELAQLLDMPGRWPDLYQGKMRHRPRFIAIRDEAIITLLIGTGIRSCEACSLRLQDLDLNRGCATVHSKGHHLYIRPQRVIFLDHPRLTGALAAYLAARPETAVDNVFTCSTGVALAPQTIWQIVTKYARLAELGKGLTPHTLRHTFCSHLMAAGVDAYSVQRLMGHRQVAYTLRWYTHLAPEQLRAEWKAFQPLQKGNGS